MSDQRQEEDGHPGRQLHTTSAAARRRLVAAWAAEDEALTNWQAADAALRAAEADRATVAEHQRAKVERAMRPFTPSTWGRAMAREAREEWHRLCPNPHLVAKTRPRVEAARAREAAALARADAKIAGAAARRAEATRTLVALRPADAHLVLGITKNALTRMTRTT